MQIFSYNYKKTIFVCLISIFSLNSVFAQIEAIIPVLSPSAKISQRIGVTDITINYSRPQVKDRTIWGKLVPFGYKSPSAVKRDNSSPWRAGAEKTTTITFSDNVSIDNKLITKGKYSLFISVFEDGTADVIINNAPNQFGSFFYNSDFDIVRVKVNTEKAPFTEYLEYGFTDIQVNSAVVYIQWERLRIPFKVELNTHKLTLEKLLIQESENPNAIDWNWRERATQYCITYKVNLKEGLRWASEALDIENFKGSRNYNTVTNYVSLLLLNNQEENAYKALEEVFPVTGINFSQFYGDQLQELGYPNAALKVWDYLKNNAPEKRWIYENGYAKAYSAIGEYTKAITHLVNAKKVLPKNTTVENIDRLINLLKKGKDINL